MNGYCVVAKMSPVAMTSEIAEMHDGIAVGDRIRFPKDLHCFPVVRFSSAAFQKRIAGPGFGRY